MMRRKRSKKKSLVFAIGIVTGLVSIISFLLLHMYRDATATESERFSGSERSHSPRNVVTYGKSFSEKITLGAIGDILIHDTVYEDAFTGEGYDFTPMFSLVKDELLKPDLLLANQETILGGVEMGLSSYPAFNSPVEVGEALLGSGVDIVSTANNHSLDRSEIGVISSIRNLESVGLPYVGSFKDKEDQNKLRILNKNGIRIGFLSYTYGTNGIPVPTGKDYLVNLIDKDKMREEISAAKELSDLVVMSIHWGNEYQRFPNQDQEDLAQYLVNQGVDVIFGHHPHVLQPMEWLQAADGRKALVVYSLGNFLSGQMWDYKDLGGMATVDILKEISPNGTKITVTNAQFIPTFVSSKRQKDYTIVPLQDAGNYGLADTKNKYSEIMNHMTQFIKE